MHLQFDNSNTPYCAVSRDSEETPQSWLAEETEKWCKKIAEIYIAAANRCPKSQRSTGEIPEPLKDALLCVLTLTLVTILEDFR